MTDDGKDAIVGKMVRERKEHTERQINVNKKIDDIKHRLRDIIFGIESNTEYFTNKDGGLTLGIKGSTTPTLYPTSEEIMSILNERRNVEERLEKLNEDLKKI